MNKILLSFVSNPYYNAKSYLFYHLEKKEMNNFTAITVILYVTRNLKTIQ